MKSLELRKKMLEYNSDEEEDNSGIANRNDEIFLETNNDLQNDVQIVEQRGEQSLGPREEIRVEVETPASNKNMKKNHLP